MATDIRTALREEAMRFADRVHDLMVSQLTSALGGGSVHASAAEPAKAPSAPRERLSQEAIEGALAQVIKVLEKHPSGLRSEQIRTELNMNKKLFQYAANLGKTSDQLTQTGERRSTVYALPRQSKAAPDEERGRVIKRRKRS